jgi:hypothetical protein
MAVLAENVEFVGVVGDLYVHIFEGGVHMAVHICRGSVLVRLIVDEACRIGCMNPVVHNLVIFSIIALVPEGPDDDGDVVSQSVDKLLCSINVGVFPFPNLEKRIGSQQISMHV